MRPLLLPLAVLSTAVAACALPEARVVEMSSANFDKLDGIDDVTGLRVDNPSGSVRVSEGGAGIEATLGLFGTFTEVRIDVIDGILVLATRCGLGPCAVDYDVRVPEDWSITVDTGSGSVNVEGLEATFVLIDTGSGSLGVTDLSADSVALDSGSGGVTLSDIAADTIRVDTGSGGVTAAAVRSLDVLASTGSGAVTFEVLTSPDILVIETGSGGVHATVPRGAYDLRLSTGSGGVNVDELENEPESPHRIDISTGSGGIQIGPA